MGRCGGCVCFRAWELSVYCLFLHGAYRSGPRRQCTCSNGAKKSGSVKASGGLWILPHWFVILLVPKTPSTLPQRTERSRLRRTPNSPHRFRPGHCRSCCCYRFCLIRCHVGHTGIERDVLEGSLAARPRTGPENGPHPAADLLPARRERRPGQPADELHDRRG